MNAFSELVQERPYDDIRVGDIVQDADVGRSTFYQHYSGKDDVLIESMGGMLDVLADAVCDESESGRLENLLSHFWENRHLGRELLCGPPSLHVLPRITRELARRIELRLRAELEEEGATALLSPRLIAIQAAEAQFALIKAWLSRASGAADVAESPSQIAVALRRSSRAAVHALLARA